MALKQVTIGMRHFSIRELERLSGIKAHTIRAWEGRYSVFSPQRTHSNIRYYSVDDLKYLLNIALLKKDHRISTLAGISKDILEELLLSLKGEEAQKAQVINNLAIHMFREDIDHFEGLLDECLLMWGMDETLSSIVLPFLDKVGILSYSSSSTEVHFVVTAIRRKIIFGIESSNIPSAGSEKALLFLPLGEHYDLILLYINYILKTIGVHVFYLGTNISLDNLDKVISDKKPTVLFSYISSRQFIEKIYSNTLKHHLPEAKLYIFHPFESREMKSNCANIVFQSVNELHLLREF